MEKRLLKIFLTFLLLFCLISVQAQQNISAEKFKNRIDISINNHLFTSYISSNYHKYPYFFPVNGPSFASVTSMKNGNYPHHSSLFFGCDRVNGGNYWQEGLDRGQIISENTQIKEANGQKVIITDECIWVRPDAPSPVKDYRTITITAPKKDLFIIDFSITMEMLMDVTIEKTNHSLFSGRMDPDLAVINGGTMINAEGKKGEKETFGKNSPWMDYYGKRGDQLEGMAIMQHPSNPWYPAQWFTRDYGFFSPTPMYWPENGKDIKLKKGEKITLHYRVIVHAGDTKSAEIDKHFKEYKKTKFN